jgi:Mce-associated membrane protein
MSDNTTLEADPAETPSEPAEFNSTTATGSDTESPAAQNDTGDGEIDTDVDTHEGAEVDLPDEPDQEPPTRRRIARLAGVVVVVVLAALMGLLGYQAYQYRQAQTQRDLYLQVGRQAAINLTTIDFAEADKDVKRILDSATGNFYDDFSARSQPFVDVVKQAKSKSVGTVSSAGLETVNGNEAQVLVAISVKSSNAGAAEQQPRDWRMRISVHKVGDEVKVSNVEFVP